MSVLIVASGLQDMQDYFERLPDIAEQAAVYAINDVSERSGLTAIRRTMRKQIDFPAGYLEQGNRLAVVRKARKGDLQATIRGRDRATSLARFAKGQTPENTRKRGVRVQVSPGQTRLLKKAFMVRLRNGNLGLAVRVKPGEKLRGSDGAVYLGRNVYLLYGPSVDQVFRGVSDEQTPDILSNLSNQFLRQFARLTRDSS